ncbi:MAG: hypothetical protein KBT34_01295 [Prevotella sp.]|nr:hypothetical protein [Candidatus Prevotella equi]
MRKIALILMLMMVTIVMAQKINRKAVVTRNNPHVTTADNLSSLTVGNGHFATTVDVTGLQSFPKDYEEGVPLCAMSDWGWHSFPNIDKLQPSETNKVMNLGHGREEEYAVEYKTQGRNKDATEYFRVNPHRVNLGNMGFVFVEKGDTMKLSDIKDIDQTLNLYDGNIRSKFSVLGTPVTVTTAARADYSALMFSANTRLFTSGKAKLAFTLPYVTGKHADAATEWGKDDAHKSNIFYKSQNSVVIRHKMDSAMYFVRISWIGKAAIEQVKPHTYMLSPKGEKIDVQVEYALNHEDLHNAFIFSRDINEVKNYWNNWWNEGAIVDFSDCSDTRAKELERRVVLSQYLTYINCANETPAQETGLTYNSWFGRPHLEMTWWHTVDFSLWNRPNVMAKILEWYNEKAYPMARKIAERQHFKGIRWMKMTDPWVGESPSNVGSFLTWQQPHYIYMAEEMYRHNPTPETLAKYAKYVEETAEFMADFALSCAKDGEKIKLHGQTAMQESMSKDFSYHHPFEQVYWVYGLKTAQTWRERQGLSRHAEWDDIISRMASLPEHDGIYTAGAPTQPFLDAATGDNAFDPFDYGGDTGKKQLSADEFYLKCRSDHPAVLGACGLLPSYGLYDKAKMQKTLDWVMDNWNWPTTWGWDYGMTAMCAARLGDGENAIRALLIDKGKNTYLVSGHNYQEPKRLRLYLPGNGALLDAVAMMCAGWDGCPEISNPGFPQDGKWNVKWEGLRKMQ